jgi:hypothetical protein
MIYVRDDTPPEWVRQRYHEARQECLRLSKDKSHRNQLDRELAAAKALDLKHYLQRLQSPWKTH